MSSLLPSSSPFLFIKVGVIQRIQSKVMDRMCSVPQSSLTLVTPGTVAHQAPLSMGFPRQEYWNGLPFPTQMDLPNPEIEPVSPALAGGFFTTEPLGKPNLVKPVENNLAPATFGQRSNSLICFINWISILMVVIIECLLWLLSFSC